MKNGIGMLKTAACLALQSKENEQYNASMMGPDSICR